MSLEKAKAYLSERGYLDHLIEPEASTATVELAAAALGVQPGQIAKTLSFLVDDEAVLILAEGNTRVDNRKFKDFFHTKATMLTADEAVELLGHAVGGVCPFALKDGVDTSALKEDRSHSAENTEK